MIKTRIITNVAPGYLDIELNKALESIQSTNVFEEIKDIKYCVSEDANTIHYSALIIYKTIN